MQYWALVKEIVRYNTQKENSPIQPGRKEKEWKEMRKERERK